MKRKYEDIQIGKTYHNWTVIGDRIIKNKRTYWKCMCNCEKQTIKYVNDYDLKTGLSKSCGCLKHETNPYKESFVSFADYNIEKLGSDFLEKYWDYEKNTYDPYEIAKSSNKLIWIRCQNNEKHGSYDITCGKFYSGRRCPYCGNARLKKEDSFAYKYPEYVHLWSDKNILNPDQVFALAARKIWFRCPCGKHDDFKRRLVDSVNYEFRCPSCVSEMKESVIQHKTRLFLESLGYTINHEYACTILPKSPINNKPLPFDNEVEDLKLIIEVHGEQHYNISGWNILSSKSKRTSPTEEFENLKFRDSYKKEFALSNGYEYLEIPYWLFTDESYKHAINDKINYIVSNI